MVSECTGLAELTKYSKIKQTQKRGSVFDLSKRHVNATLAIRRDELGCMSVVGFRLAGLVAVAC